MTFAILTAGFLILGNQAHAEPTLVAHEVTLPPFQQESLQFDLPVHAMKFDNEGNLWMVGQRGVWLWSVKGNKLKRIELGKQLPRSHRLFQISSDAVSLFVGSTLGLFQINSNPLKIYHFKLTQELKGFPLGFSGTGDQFVWLHSSGIYRVDRYGKTLIKVRDLDFIRRSDQVLYSASANALWLLRKNNLMVVKADGPANAAQIVHQAEGQLNDLFQWRSSVVTHTSKSVLFFESDGTLSRSIPVAAGRNLVAIEMGTSKHHYLFDDGVVESYDLVAQSQNSFTIPAKIAQTSKKLAVWGDRIALLDNAKPRLFLLPKAVD